MFDKLSDLPIDTVPATPDEQNIVDIMFAHQDSPLSTTCRLILYSISVWGIVWGVFSLQNEFVTTTIPPAFHTVFKAFVCAVLFYLATIFISYF